MAETDRRLLTPVKPSARRRTPAEATLEPESIDEITALLGDVAISTGAAAPSPPRPAPDPPRRPLYRVIDGSTPPLAADGGVRPRLEPGPSPRCRACLRRHLEAHGNIRGRAATPFTSFTLDLLRALSIAAKAAGPARILVVDPRRLVPGRAVHAGALRRELTGLDPRYLAGEYVVLGAVPAGAVVGVWDWAALRASPLLRVYLPADVDGLLGRGVDDWRRAVEDQPPRPVARRLDPDGALLAAAVRSQWGRGEPVRGGDPAVTTYIVNTITGWRDRRPYAPLPGRAQFYDTIALPRLAVAVRGHVLDDINQGREAWDGGRDGPGAHKCRCADGEAAMVLARAAAELRGQIVALEPAMRDILQTAAVLRNAVVSRAPESDEAEATLAGVWPMVARHQSALAELAALLRRSEETKTVSTATCQIKSPRPVVRLPPAVPPKPGRKVQPVISIAVTEVS